MDINQRIECLAAIDLFASFTEDELRIFAEKIEEVHFPQSKEIFEEGTLGHDMYVLLEGSLKIFKNNRTIRVISPIDYVGEMAIIEDKPRSATVISNTAVTTAGIFK